MLDLAIFLTMFSWTAVNVFGWPVGAREWLRSVRVVCVQAAGGEHRDEFPSRFSSLYRPVVLCFSISVSF